MHRAAKPKWPWKKSAPAHEAAHQARRAISRGREIVKGSTAADESNLTGEATPVGKKDR